jgi:hypothetical protein
MLNGFHQLKPPVKSRENLQVHNGKIEAIRAKIEVLRPSGERSKGGGIGYRELGAVARVTT